MVSDVPHGFKRAVGSGLILPEEVSRKRIVCTEAEGRAFERTLKLLDSMFVTLQMKCQNPECKSVMQKVRGDDGSVTLRCDCSDRVFQRAF